MIKGNYIKKFELIMTKEEAKVIKNFIRELDEDYLEEISDNMGIDEFFIDLYRAFCDIEPSFEETPTITIKE